MGWRWEDADKMDLDCGRDGHLDIDEGRVSEPKPCVLMSI